MALPFYPKAGQVLVCEFSGFVEPEMVKPRPVVVISPRLPHRSEIVTIVPLSTTAPKHEFPFVYRLSRNYKPGAPLDLPCWAKADMVVNIGRWRLNSFKVGRRRWEAPQMTKQDLEGVRRAVLWGMGMGHLIREGDSAI
jgi:uncharacterized protein YifN (PemK superfamily)